MFSFLGRLFGTFLTLLFIIASALLALGNPEAVSLSLWPSDLNIAVPIWLMISASFGLGLLIGGLVMLGPIMKHRMTIRSLTKELSKKEKVKLEENNKKPALPAK